MSAPQLAGSSEATAATIMNVEEGNKSPTSFPREGWRFLLTLPLVKTMVDSYL